MKKIVITKTPLRVSFVGGGTDFSEYFIKYGGKVVSTSIDRFIYVTVKKHSKLFNEQFRLNYSEAESVNTINQIKNEITKACLKFLKVKTPLYISTISDIPVSSGLGSSSAFTVGLLNALHYFFDGKKVSASQLAREAVYIEKKILKKPIGFQDQYATAYGGLNLINFNKKNIKVKKIKVDKLKINKLFENICLIWTKIQRNSSTVLSSQKKNINKKINLLHNAQKLCNEFRKELEKKDINIKNLGNLVDLNWKLKKNFTKGISNQYIDKLYKISISSGAIGAKISGAGAGGFLIVFANKKVQSKLKGKFIDNKFLKINYEDRGSRIIYAD